MSGEWKRFPAVLRKLSTEKMFREYLSLTRGDEAPGILGRTIFVSLVNTFTRGEQKRKAAVDYVFGTLLYDRTKTAREMVVNEVQDVEARRLLLEQLCFTEEFLKFTFLEHIGSDTDAFRNVDIALSGTTISTSSH